MYQRRCPAHVPNLSWHLDLRRAPAGSYVLRHARTAPRSHHYTFPRDSLKEAGP